MHSLPCSFQLAFCVSPPSIPLGRDVNPMSEPATRSYAICREIGFSWAEFLLLPLLCAPYFSLFLFSVVGIKRCILQAALGWMFEAVWSLKLTMLFFKIFRIHNACAEDFIRKNNPPEVLFGLEFNLQRILWLKHPESRGLTFHNKHFHFDEILCFVDRGLVLWHKYIYW